MPVPAGGGARNDTGVAEHEGRGSIIVVVASHGPLLPHQLERIARRVSLGLGKLRGQFIVICFWLSERESRRREG